MKILEDEINVFYLGVFLSSITFNQAEKKCFTPKSNLFIKALEFKGRKKLHKYLSMTFKMYRLLSHKNSASFHSHIFLKVPNSDWQELNISLHKLACSFSSVIWLIRQYKMPEGRLKLRPNLWKKVSKKI